MYFMRKDFKPCVSKIFGVLVLLLNIKSSSPFQIRSVYNSEFFPGHNGPSVGSSISFPRSISKCYYSTDDESKITDEENDESIALNAVGKAVNEAPLMTSEFFSAASESILSRDPSSIEIIPFTQSSDNGSEATITSPDFVKMFRGSASYIANHRNTVVVYHIPGELLDWKSFPDLMDDIALTWLLGMKPVIVVGCRKQIDLRLLANKDGHAGDKADKQTSENPADGAGIRYDFVRITDFETLRIVKEEAGYVRFEVERQLGRSLCRHGGILHDASEDGNVVSGNFYSAQPFGVLDGIDFMYTGFPRRVEVEKIRQVLAANDIVLLTALGTSPSGEVFNVNSENLAAAVAGSLAASKVIYFTVEGTAFRDIKSKKLVQNLRASDARNLLDYHRVQMHQSRGFASIEDDTNHSPAMVEALLKVGWSMSALQKGVKRAHIIAPTNGALLQELYTRDGSGTLISRDIYEGIRRADVNDVASIYDLIDPLVSAGTLVPRPKTVLEKDIDSYFVYTRDNLIVACAQLKFFEQGFAEIGCMVVSKDYRSQGRGDAMLGYLERLSLKCGCSKVFVLSTQTMEWFIERGFTAVTVDILPPTRKAVYNAKRKSKIYMKEIEDDRDLDAAELWWNR